MALSVKISINGQTQREIDNIPWSSGMNAQAAMEAAYHSGMGYSFTLQYFGADLGYEIVSIDGIASEAGTDLYLFWEFSVNQQIASKGNDQTFPQDGDRLEWNFKAYDPAKHGSSRHAAIKQKLARRA
jgi:hypothetical protein